MSLKTVLGSRYFLEGIAAVLCFVVGAFLAPYAQAVVLALGGALLGHLMTTIPWPPEGFWSSTFLRSVLMMAVIFAAFLLGWWLGYPHIQKFPREDGLVASFNTGKGGPARNVFGETFGVFLDSEHNVQSKAWYECVTLEDGVGFLRIHYELASSDKTPYVGVYTDFSHPPTEVLDISRFSALALKIRISEAQGESVPNVFVAVPTANIKGAGLYDYCEYRIPRHELQPQWIDVVVPFEDFSTPPYSLRPNQLDPARAFRVSIAIKGSPGCAQSGYIDVDEIRFEK